MAEQKQRVHTTPAMKKRRVATAAEDQPAHMNRVVLGELPNMSNVVASVDPNTRVKCKSKAMDKNKGLATTSAKTTEVIDGKSDNPQPRRAYHAFDNYEYLRKIEMEPKRRPLPDYLEKVQEGVTAYMRGILVDWLVEIAVARKLLPHTLHLSISYVDRFLSLNAVNKQKLQLLGVSSMLIASKYEEISPPKVKDFCEISNNILTKKEVVEMEVDILNSLKFEMGNLLRVT
ncbi:cyclin-A3-2-like [Corylus avellana]|uniref:cyclin-A3-2-like n=1 Tax=Corylus avellana TaxID=13451 RepID=UPI001E23277D|nr:cyclin-A3-2-like [Corylus avellana]